MNVLKGSGGIALVLAAGFVVSGCAKVSVRDVLDHAEEQTLVRWVPVEKVEPSIDIDKVESLRSGSIELQVVRQEKPIYAVKNAQVSRETTTRRLEHVPGMGIDWPYPIGCLMMPVAVATYSVMAVVGFPEKCYQKAGTREWVQVPLEAGEVQGRPEEYRWSPAPGVKVWCTLNTGKTLSARSDESGRARFDLLSLAAAPEALEKGLSMAFKLKRKGPAAKCLTLEPGEVAELLWPQE